MHKHVGLVGLVIGLTGLGSSGCFVDHRGGIGGPVPTGAPLSIIENGGGVTINPGVEAGYGITSNTGSSFRIVWTGDAGVSGSYSEFWGSVWTTGRFSSVIPGCGDGSCPLEGDDYLSPIIPLASGERIDWDTFATSGIDGFDFVSSDEPVYFAMYIDGTRYPSLTSYIDGSTGAQASAPALPFGLTTQ